MHKYDFHFFSQSKQRLAVSDRGLAPGGHEQTPAPAAVFPNRSSSELLQGNTTAKSGPRAANSLVVTSPSNITAAADKNRIEADDDVDVLRDDEVEKRKTAPARLPGNKLLQSESSSGATMSSKVKTLADSTSTKTTPFFCRSRNSEKGADCSVHDGAQDACTADTDNECLWTSKTMVYVMIRLSSIGKDTNLIDDCVTKAESYYSNCLYLEPSMEVPDDDIIPGDCQHDPCKSSHTAWKDACGVDADVLKPDSLLFLQQMAGLCDVEPPSTWADRLCNGAFASCDAAACEDHVLGPCFGKVGSDAFDPDEVHDDEERFRCLQISQSCFCGLKAFQDAGCDLAKKKIIDLKADVSEVSDVKKVETVFRSHPVRPDQEGERAGPGRGAGGAVPLV
ncbi:unnamed protein product [Amoebophrya sp. A120]|nr:unnamed protein product [Amoebophrya sp. A120]|eukprot:GSA120T00022895001.1